ncbi:hypothetical protein ACF3OC_12390 [Sphingobacterium cellulitidis]|uniref:hypothetical protein n=1 Tax=Sphingobacterium cellulitidis TaxID=1768011 RepID=UPI000B942B4A|nr:hypothetical protein CHT99_19390 [Sphingobacterium cellulitidis]
MLNINIQTSFKNLITLFISSSNSKVEEDLIHKYIVLREELHYTEAFDETILKAKSVYSLKHANATVPEFIEWFISNFNNSWLTEFCSEEIRERNNRVQNAFINIQETLYRTQSWMKEEKLRTKVDIDWEKRGRKFNLLHQTITIFCDIALACNQKGEYYISYNLDYRCQELIGKFFTNTLLRRFYEFTMDDLEPYLNLNSFLVDGLDNFTEALKESRNNEFVKASLVPNS